jgi:hypothetical protein
MILLLLLGFAGAMQAQTGFYVPRQGKVFFTGSTATIFSDVNLQGQMGVGRNATVNFKGRKWVNASAADITDEKGGRGLGGMIRFLAPDTGIQQQSITSAYNAAVHTGPVFTNLTIENGAGVRLLSGSMKVRRWLNFVRGTLDVGDNILVVGDNDAGMITGYSDKSFIITPGTSSNGGFLLRERLTAANGMVVFPVGTAAGHYTPAGLRVRSPLPDDFYVRVSDGAKRRLTDGGDLSDWSVNKTWQIGQLQHPGEDAVEITLQHDVRDEGGKFMDNRQTAYVSQYSDGSWDIGYPQGTPGAGFITTSGTLADAGTNTRSFQYTMSQASYFTKLAGFNDTARNRTKLWFSAYRTDGKNAYVYWTTNPEIRNKYFVVQRRLINEQAFSNRDTLPSLAISGVSFNYLEYHVNDPNNYKGTSFYRLQMMDYNGNISYSNIVAVGGVPDGFGWTVWPNPTAGRCFVGISRPSAVKEVLVWDAIGRLVTRQQVNNRGLIEMYLHAKGAYMIGLAPSDGDHIETKKLIVIGD